MELGPSNLSPAPFILVFDFLTGALYSEQIFSPLIETAVLTLK